MLHLVIKLSSVKSVSGKHCFGIPSIWGRGNDNPPQYSCLENSTDREIWQPMVHRVTKSQRWPKWPSTHEHTHMHVCVLVTSVVSDSLWPHVLQPTRLLCPWDFSGKNTTVGCDFLLLGIFPTHESNPCLLCLLHCRWILYLLSHQGNPRLG